MRYTTMQARQVERESEQRLAWLFRANRKQKPLPVSGTSMRPIKPTDEVYVRGGFKIGR